MAVINNIFKPGESASFWWSRVDCSHYHAAELICVRPTHTTHLTENAMASSLSSEAENTLDRSIFYKWSGAFDPCNLGTTALRIRLDSKKHEHLNYLQRWMISSVVIYKSFELQV